jgi:hypothetical protein
LPSDGTPDANVGSPKNAVIPRYRESLVSASKTSTKGFGIRRIIKPGGTPHRFKPENAREESAVHDFERDGLRVALYLTGRRVLTADGPVANADASTATRFG